MEELYRENIKIVFHFLCSLCHDEGLAEELTQETFLKTYQSIKRYDGSCKISTWLCAIAKNTYYQYLSKANKEIPKDMSSKDISSKDISTEEQIWEVTPEREVLAKIELMDVLKLMQSLPETMREVMYLRITGALTFKEIGEIMGKSENWTRVTFYRGKERILKEYHSKNKKGE